MPHDRPGLLDRARGALDVLVREMLKFGMVGAVAFVIDLGGYNLLVFGPHHDKDAEVIRCPTAGECPSARHG